LAEQFNRMFVQLRDAYTNLEKTVAERTINWKASTPSPRLSAAR